MIERAYTVKEIDELRKVCEYRWLFGSSVPSAMVEYGRSYQIGEKEKAVEEIVRTHMLAGHVAQDLIDEDTRQSPAS
jgi:hypothetical protein